MSITVAALFTKNSGQPATGLTLAEIDLYLYRRKKADGVVSTVWSGQHPTEEIGGGLYSKAYSVEDVATYEYFAYGQYTGATVLDTDYATQGTPWFSEAAVWGYDTRTLTSAAADEDEEDGVTITIRRGDSLSQSITGLGDITNRTKLWFTAKENYDDDDVEAVIQIEETAGLIRFNGLDASARAVKGDITVDNATTGNITIVLDEQETDDLHVQGGLVYDIQVLRNTGAVNTLELGNVVVSPDVTRAVA